MKRRAQLGQWENGALLHLAPMQAHLSPETDHVPRTQSSMDVKMHHAEGAEIVRRGFKMPYGGLETYKIRFPRGEGFFDNGYPNTGKIGVGVIAGRESKRG